MWPHSPPSLTSLFSLPSAVVFYFVQLLRTPFSLLDWMPPNLNRFLFKQALKRFNMPQFIFNSSGQKRKQKEILHSPQGQGATRGTYLSRPRACGFPTASGGLRASWILALQLFHEALSDLTGAFLSGLSPDTGWSQTGSDLETGPGAGSA